MLHPLVFPERVVPGVGMVVGPLQLQVLNDWLDLGLVEGGVPVAVVRPEAVPPSWPDPVNRPFLCTFFTREKLVKFVDNESVVFYF